MPSETSRFASTTSESTVCCTSPGIEAIGVGASIPSRTNSGATRSSTPRRASATRRRSAGVRRNRRRRRTGNPVAGRGRVVLGHTDQPTSRPPSRIPAMVAEVVGQLGHDALGRGTPGLVHARHPYRPRRLGGRRPDADDVSRDRHRVPSGVRKRHERVHRRGRGEHQCVRLRHPRQESRSRAPRPPPCGRPPPAARPNPSPPARVDRVRRDVGTGKQHAPCPVRVDRGTPAPTRARCARREPGPPRRQPGAARRPSQARPRRRGAPPSSRASRSSAMKRSAALTEVNTTQRHA